MRSLLFAFAVLAASAHVADAAPELGVMIASVADTSSGAPLDAPTRSAHAAIVRRALLAELQRTDSRVRWTDAGAQRLDVSVVRWQIEPGASETAVAVELRVVVADARGRMRAILTGRARISAPARAPLPALRAQAIAEAIHGMSAGLHTQLARAVG